MDSFASDRKLSELGELDLQDLLDDQSDLFTADDDQRPMMMNSRRRTTSHDTDTAGDCVSLLI